MSRAALAASSSFLLHHPQWQQQHAHIPRTLHSRQSNWYPSVQPLVDWVEQNQIKHWGIPDCLIFPIKVIPECEASEENTQRFFLFSCENRGITPYHQAKCFCDGEEINRKKESYEREAQCYDGRCGEKDAWELKCTQLRWQTTVQRGCDLFLPGIKEEMGTLYGMARAEELIAEADQEYPYDEEKDRLDEIPSVCDQFPTVPPTGTSSATGPVRTIKVESDGKTTTVEVSSCPRVAHLQMAALLTLFVSSFIVQILS